MFETKTARRNLRSSSVALIGDNEAMVIVYCWFFDMIIECSLRAIMYE